MNSAVCIAERALGLAVPIKILVVYIRDSNGEDLIQVARSQEEADDILFNHAVTGWDYVLEGTPAPTDKKELVETYFELTNDWYDIFYESVWVSPSEVLKR